MKNIALFNEMITKYNDKAFTHNYIYGFTYANNVYMSFAKSDIMPYVLTLDTAGRNCGMSLRFKPNKAQKVALLTNAKILCSVEYFESIVNNSKYNKGEIYEKLVTEYFGQEWTKDNVPFTVAGDIEVNGIAYQIKYEKATFVNEKGLARI